VTLWARESDTETRPAARRRGAEAPFPWRAYLGAAGTVALVTAAATPLRHYVDLANIEMLFLLAVVFAATRLGRGPALLAALLSVAAFDFFFVPPRITFAVAGVQYLLTFAVMLIVALVIGQLTAGLKFRWRWRRAASSASAPCRDGAGAVQRAHHGADRRHQRALRRPRVQRPRGALEPGQPRRAAPGGGHAAAVGRGSGIAQWALDHNESAGLSTGTLPSAKRITCLSKRPCAPAACWRWCRTAPSPSPQPEQQRLLETSATLVAIAVERVHFIAVAQEALVHMESERLRNSLLGALSHDLRTPLTVLAGLADSLGLAGPPLPPEQAEIARSIREEALRTSALVNNLLDMARLQSGDLRSSASGSPWRRWWAWPCSPAPHRWRRTR